MEIPLESKKNGLIICDIGGTNARAQYIQDKFDQKIKIEMVSYKTNDFKNFIDFLTKYLSENHPAILTEQKIDLAICIASKVQNNRCVSAANFDWTPTDGEIIK